MNLEYVILGSDENPMYFDFWPIVSKVWKEIFNVTPVLGLISNKDSDLNQDDYGLIKKFKKIDSLSVGLQSQCIRLYLPKFLNGNCLISDIDMLPLSVEYFTKTSEELDEDNVIVHSSDNKECVISKMYPMCYVSAHSKTFQNIFDLSKDWITFITELNSRSEGWYTDQKFLYEKIHNYHLEKNQCILKERGWDSRGIANKRIDRINWEYDESKVSEGFYIDSHLQRPYLQYREDTDKLINLLHK